MRWLLILVAGACDVVNEGATDGVDAQALPDDAEVELTERAADEGSGHNGGGASAVFYCGNGRCDPGERHETCPDECGVRLGNWTTALAPRLYEGREPVEATHHCDSNADGWHVGGRPELPSGLPNWTVGARCDRSALTEGRHSDYDCRSARYHFIVPRDGHFDGRAWVPGQHDACASATDLSTAVSYFLFRDGSVPAPPSAPVDIDQAANMGRHVTLFTRLFLSAGVYTILVPDDIPSGEERRIYVDTILIDRL